MKVKEKFKKKAKEVLEWVKENPKATTMIAIVTAAGGAAIATTVKAAKNKISGEDIIAEEIEDIPSIYDWNEEYEEKYEKVKEFAKSLDLDKYEEFVIERCPNCDDGIIVSHLVDGVGVYKPED